MSTDLLTRDERKIVDSLDLNYDGLASVELSAREVDRLVEAFARIAPKPEPKPLEQTLYEAENLSEKPWSALNVGERSQYVRMAQAAREALEARS